MEDIKRSADRTDEKAEPKPSADQVAALKLATGKSDLKPTAMTTLAPATITYSARCGKILGIGHPAGGADEFELTLAGDPAGGEDEVVILTVPRVLEHYQYFHPGSYYCQPLNAAGEPIEPISILPPAFFTAATAAPPPEGGALAAKRKEEERQRLEKERAGVQAAGHPPQVGARGPAPSSTIKR